MEIKKTKQKQAENKNYNKYVGTRAALIIGIFVCITLGVVMYFFYNKQVEGQYVYYDWQRFSWAFMFLPIIAICITLIVQRKRTERYVTRKCDIVCYTRINSRFYDRIQGGFARKRALVTVFIDFHSGNFDRVAMLPKLLPMPVLHVMPEFLMYYALACLARGDRAGIDMANNFITDHKYFRTDHKKPVVLYATAFSVVRFTQKMMDGQYESALDCVRYLAIPPKKFRYYDAQVRFCKARAEHELALQAKEDGDLQRVLTYSKAALGKYAHVGRNCGNLYIARQAEFFRVQLHEMINQK